MTKGKRGRRKRWTEDRPFLHYSSPEKIVRKGKKEPRKGMNCLSIIYVVRVGGGNGKKKEPGGKKEKKRERELSFPTPPFSLPL